MSFEKRTIEVYQLPAGAISPVSLPPLAHEFPHEGIFVIGNDIYFVMDGMVSSFFMSDPNWLELFAGLGSASTLQHSSDLERMLLKVIAVSQKPELAVELAA